MKHPILLFILLCTVPVFAQQTISIAFYNQENLFDTIDDKHKNDNEFLPDAKLAWNTEKYLNKLDHMSQVIQSMNNGDGPDILGMCEVENDLVLADLTTKTKLKSCKYQFVHRESPDERSIDNALLFKSKKFKLLDVRQYAVSIDTNPHFKTRDILLVKLELKNKSSLILLVNHFPSRLGGQEKSEHKRIRAAQVLKHIFDSIRITNPNQAVIAMGDFNDEPSNISMDSVLQAKQNADSQLFNAMYGLHLQKKGSLQYRNNWNMLDQFILTSNLVNCQSTLCYEKESATIYQQPWMLETEEKYKGSPKRTFGGQKYLNGYSDHLPVLIRLQTSR